MLLNFTHPLIHSNIKPNSNINSHFPNYHTIQQQVQLINIKGIAKVTNFNQHFHYLACSVCNRASNAYENEEMWSNYCAKRVPALAKIKFYIEITDPTATIEAIVFPEVAEQVYGIIGANMMQEPLAHELLEKLAQPKKYAITLKAYMYNYAGISQCKFNVHAISDEPTPEDNRNQQQSLVLPPPTLNKQDKPNTPSSSEQPKEPNPTKKPRLN
ncbi:hypothetical protein RHMOL_Rhmol09G0063900 [Rhododendron molle]|uniref:Uncharacterized protein n=1 Tax=Rhododendron molle TaxID=49168 RepID=A0ACC0MB35_RHOML|nr:hypothetical protein RHMOL_Rhmol09G0063900 [Rhododendron molle]